VRPKKGPHKFLVEKNWKNTQIPEKYSGKSGKIPQIQKNTQNLRERGPDYFRKNTPGRFGKIIEIQKNTETKFGKILKIRKNIGERRPKKRSSPNFGLKTRKYTQNSEKYSSRIRKNTPNNLEKFSGKYSPKNRIPDAK